MAARVFRRILVALGRLGALVRRGITRVPGARPALHRPGPKDRDAGIRKALALQRAAQRAELITHPLRRLGVGRVDRGVNGLAADGDPHGALETVLAGEPESDLG